MRASKGKWLRVVGVEAPTPRQYREFRLLALGPPSDPIARRAEGSLGESGYLVVLREDKWAQCLSACEAKEISSRRVNPSDGAVRS